MTTFRLDGSAGPGTHVFLVGAGKYPNLKGGTGDPTPKPMGMGQLSSPPISAMEMLKWFDETMNNPQAPLKSIEILISQPEPAQYTDKAGTTATIDEADFAHFERAAQAWFNRANSDPQNVAVFYFCGHGLGDGINSQLLMSDYGSSPRPLRHAVHFPAFRIAMGGCKAEKQIFLLDACRVVDPTMLLDPYNMGESGLPPGNVTKMYSGANPVLYAAKIGEQAFGAHGKTSYFTAALLEGLNRCGVFHSKGTNWAVSPTQLHLAVAALMDDFSGKPQCPTDGLVGTGFQLHVLEQAPEVVVHITLNPSDGNLDAKILATCSGTVHERASTEHPWRTFLPIGPCDVEAQFTDPNKYKAKSKSLHLHPPWQEIELEVQ